MGDSIKISVVIPSFNREKTIEKCIRSVMNQSYPPYEILVVDDGSTDGTIQKIASLHIDMVRLLQQEHKGAQAARNYGIREAKGDYIAFLDSDDEWMPAKLERQVQYLKGRQDVVVYCDYYEVNRRRGHSREIITTGGNGDVYKEMLVNSGPTFPGIVCSKKALMDIGLLDEKTPAHQEWETAIRLARHNEFVHIREPLFKWNWHAGETISKDEARAMRGHAYIIEKHKWQILKHHGLKSLRSQYESLLNKSFQNGNQEFIRYFLKWMFVDVLVDFTGKRRKKVERKALSPIEFECLLKQTDGSKDD